MKRETNLQMAGKSVLGMQQHLLDRGFKTQSSSGETHFVLSQGSHLIVVVFGIDQQISRPLLPVERIELMKQVACRTCGSAEGCGCSAIGSDQVEPIPLLTVSLAKIESKTGDKIIEKSFSSEFKADVKAALENFRREFLSEIKAICD